MPDFEPRRAKPNQTFTWGDLHGVQVRVEADKDGVVQPKSEAEVRLADAFDLPVARSVIAEQKAADAAKEATP